MGVNKLVINEEVKLDLSGDTVQPDKLLAEGDILTLQGYGKLRLEAVRGNTKKGRVAVTLLRFT